MYLVDTNVVSELRRGDRAEPAVVAWATGVDSRAMHLSVMTVFELERGTLRIERRDPVQGARLRGWLDGVLDRHIGRILPIDSQVARLCARLHVPNPRSERDAFIAATAIVHGLTVVTRNVRDFAGTGAVAFDPWAAN